MFFHVFKHFGARFYDPWTMRWNSIDPALQLLNPYTYCGNNPAMYVDPDGEFFHLIIGAVIGGVANALSNGEWDWGRFAVGAVSGALGAGVGAGISSSLAVAGKIAGGFAAGFFGTSAATTATTSFVSGMAIGAGAGLASGFTSGFGNSLLDGKNFGQALGQGGLQGLMGGLSGAAIGGLMGGIDAARDGRSFWDGAKVNKTTLVDQNIPIIGQRGDMNCGPANAEAIDKSFGGNMSQEDIRNLPRLGGDPNTTPIADVDLWDAYTDASGHTMSTEMSTSSTEKLSNVLTKMKDGSRVSINLKTETGTGHGVVMKSITEKVVTKINGTTTRQLVYKVMNPANGGRIMQIPGSSISQSHRIFYINL